MRLLLATAAVPLVAAQCSNDQAYTQLTLPDSADVDPWNDVVWHTDANACFNPQIDNQVVPRLSYDSSTESEWNVNQHAVVVHNADGDRVACGVINYDVWTGVKYESDAEGNAGADSVPLSPVYGFETEVNETGKYVNAYGRTVVVHDASGTRIGCGCCIDPDTPLVNITKYPEYEGNINVTGTVSISGLNGYVTVEPNLSGLEASVSGGVHIHVGTTCATHAEVGGHLYRSNGAQMDVYPGYEGTDRILGFVDVEADTSSSILFSTALLNQDNSFPSDASGGIHIHEGTTCSNASAVGGHFWDTSTTTTTTTTKVLSSGASSGIAAAAAVVAVLVHAL